MHSFYDSVMFQSLEQELQAQKTMVRHAEKRCQQIDLESQEKVDTTNPKKLELYAQLC